MKVLHVLDTSVPDISGYTTRARYLTVHQKKLGIEPVVLTSERLKRSPAKDREVIDGIRHYRSERRSGAIRKIPVVAELHEIRTLRRRIDALLLEERPDIIHGHSPSLIGSATNACCRERGIPSVYEIRAFWEDAAVDRGSISASSLRYLLRRYHETRVAKGADSVITICDGLQADLEERGIPSTKIHVVRNGVDHHEFEPVPTDQKLQDELGCAGNIVIGFVGSFFHFEGLQDLIRALPDITHANPEVILLLVGAGQMYDDLQALTRRLGMENHVRFTGRVPHEQVTRYYSVMDVLVYPRISERITELVTPLKPLEAMSMAKPTLMSDVGGLQELAGTTGVARFFEAGNVKDLARQCLSLCNDFELRERIGRQARRHIVDSWSWESRAKETINLYGSLITTDQLSRH